MEEQEPNQDDIVRELLRGTGFSVVDAARLALELREMLPAEQHGEQLPMPLSLRIIRLGVEAYLLSSRTVSFREAVERSLQSRAGRRSRTLAEIRQCCRRLLRSDPRLADMPVRSITSDYCHELIMGCFHTPTSQRKARRLLHAIFAFSLRHGWCATNPVKAVDVPQVQEKKIEALSIPQIRRLLTAARKPEHLPCAPAIGIMLWAGIRPTELTRLRWEDVRIGDRNITVDAHHSKTGGARQVPLYPVLIKWLHETAPFRLPQAHIVPRAWVRRWRALRLAAGFDEWNPDTLRHTFASYHFKYHGDFGKLQAEMGHGDVELLRTRYLGMRGITREGAEQFWGKRSPRNGSSEGRESLKLCYPIWK